MHTHQCRHTYSPRSNQLHHKTCHLTPFFKILYKNSPCNSTAPSAREQFRPRRSLHPRCRQPRRPHRRPARVPPRRLGPRLSRLHLHGNPIRAIPREIPLSRQGTQPRHRPRNTARAGILFWQRPSQRSLLHRPRRLHPRPLSKEEPMAP